MLVSVILPAYNDERHLGAALRRIARQKGIDLEVIVVDDGSSDGTAVIAQRAAETDDRIRLISLSRNGGVARARERGVAEARGDYVWFVDSDDDWRDDAASLLVRAAADADADVVVAGARFLFESGRPPKELPAPAGGPISGEDAFRRLLKGRITGHLWNKLFRRSLLTRIEYVPARVQSDLPMVAGALARARRVAFLDQSVYDYRIRSGSIITTRSQRAESLALIEDSVRRSAALLPEHVLAGDDFRYFLTRYVVLSGIKDAALGAYEDDDRRRRLAVLRSRITRQELLLLARARDGRRLALALAARSSERAYLRLLRLADR